MAFAASQLRLIHDSVDGEGRLWYYLTTDAIGTVTASGYFAGMAASITRNGLKLGDVVMIKVVDSLTAPTSCTNYLRAVSAIATNDATVAGSVDGVGSDEVVFTAEGVSSKASDAAVTRFVMPFAGVITKVYTVINAALATADATVTTAIGGVAVTNGVVTITQSGSAAGDIDVATPTAARTVAAGNLVTLTVGGGSTATATLNAVLVVQRT